MLQVEWEHQTCDQGVITLSSDTETSGELTIPFMDQILEVTQDGLVLWEKGSAYEGGVYPSPNGLVIPLTGGDHSLLVHFDC